MKELTSVGVGVEKQSADPQTKDMEETLWRIRRYSAETLLLVCEILQLQVLRSSSLCVMSAQTVTSVSTN